MATQNIKRKNLTLVVCFLLLIKGERKNVCYLQPLPSMWGPLPACPSASHPLRLAFCQVTSPSASFLEGVHLLRSARPAGSCRLHCGLPGARGWGTPWCLCGSWKTPQGPPVVFGPVDTDCGDRAWQAPSWGGGCLSPDALLSSQPSGLCSG